MRKILFVDRDGTLVKEPTDFQIDRLEKVKLVEGVVPALLRLQNNGFFLVIVTNQDGLGTESFPYSTFKPVHDFIIDLFTSQGVRFIDTLICPHLPADHCACRKPNTGLLTSYLKDASIDWERSAVIGDRESDVKLANALGVRSYHLNTGGGQWGWADISEDLISQPRVASVRRQTKETIVMAEINLDGSGRTQLKTGIGFFDHMLEQLARHSGIDLTVSVKGDNHIDDHHSVEDAGITIGSALRKALSDKFGVGRFGFCLPMDECRAEALIDLSGRTFCKVNIPFTTDRIGNFATELVSHFFESLAGSAGMSLHITTSLGNNHHMAEAAFKSFARALRQAIAISDPGQLPTTKGAL